MMQAMPRQWGNVALTGLYFGVLQWCSFFLLQSYLASTALVYLLATSAWLAGSIGGLIWNVKVDERWWLGASIAAYFGLKGTAAAHPFNLAWLPLLLVFVAIMGGYAGRFFRVRQPDRQGSKWLFFVENSGYLAGMLGTAVGLFFAGEGLLMWAPPVLAITCGLSLGRVGQASAPRRGEGRATQ